MMAIKPVATPIEQNHRLSEALGQKKVDRKMYQQLCWDIDLSWTYKAKHSLFNECN